MKYLFSMKLLLTVVIGGLLFVDRVHAIPVTCLLQSNPQSQPTQQEFIADVRQNYEKENFSALDYVAFQSRINKERFPGGEWRLAVFYQTLLFPNRGASAADSEWKGHLDRLQKWVKAAPDSMTARIALAASWIEYAKKGYTSVDEWTDFDKQIGGKTYQERLRQAERALGFDPAKLMNTFLGRIKTEVTFQGNTKLRSYCPHWYVVKLRIEQGRAWDWDRYNNIFAEGVALEPTYYPLYLTKAADLLPQNHGGKHEWERFADTVARALGGKEGAIVYYLIVAHARSFFNNAMIKDNFFEENYISLPRVLESYKQLEATYGTTVIRLNEMALLASLAKEHALAKVFFDRIGTNCDITIWQEKSMFDAFQNIANAKASPKEVAGWPGGPYGSGYRSADYSGLRATVSSSAAAYIKSDDIVIDVLIENPTDQAKTVDTYELSHPALSLIIVNASGRQSEMMMPPNVGDPKPINKTIKPGESVHFTYRLGFSLPPGDYKLRMRSIASNEMLLRIGRPQGRSLK